MQKPGDGAQKTVRACRLRKMGGSCGGGSRWRCLEQRGGWTPMGCKCIRRQMLRERRAIGRRLAVTFSPALFDAQDSQAPRERGTWSALATPSKGHLLLGEDQLSSGASSGV